MVNINPNRESCMEYMKELIRKGLQRNEIVKECRKHFKGVDKNTFYDWYKIIIKDQDIKSWEEDNRIEIIDKRADKINLKHQIYLDQKKIYNNEESEKEEKEKAMNILLNHFLKKVDL
tara:strand:- start:784 stop:1137 length:354 start_codon:yes stop_codon:yes gene_type:complete